MEGGRAVQGKMIFYPNEECLFYAEKVVTEIESILKNLKKTIESSLLREYVSVLEKGQCDDFLKVCTKEYKRLRIGQLCMTTGPSFLLLTFLQKRLLRKKKQLLYSKCLLSLKSIEEELKSTTENDRIFLLKVAKILDETIAEELKHDLINQ